MARPNSSTRRRPYADWTGEALLEALVLGDELAFREIYDRHWYPLYRLAYRKLGLREEAEEIVQELFTALWLKRGTASIGSLEPYLYRAAKFKVIDAIRLSQTRQRYREASGSLSESDRNTEEALAALDLSEALMAAVAGLPDYTRQIFHLSRVEHKTVAEIAELLAISPKTVEYHLTKALKFLRVGLKDFLTVLLFCLLTQD